MFALSFDARRRINDCLGLGDIVEWGGVLGAGLIFRLVRIARRNCNPFYRPTKASVQLAVQPKAVSARGNTAHLRAVNTSD